MTRDAEAEQIRRAGLSHKSELMSARDADLWGEADFLHDVHYLEVGQLDQAQERMQELQRAMDELLARPRRTVIVNPYQPETPERPGDSETGQVPDSHLRVPPMRHPQPALLRRGTLVALVLILGSVPMLLLGKGAMLATLYIGVSSFYIANYAAARAGEPNILIRPTTAVIGGACMLGLAATAIATALFN